MEKLKRYNQKLLAIIGTLVLLTVIVLLITGIVAIIYETTRDRNYTDDSITIEEQDNQQVKLRDQEISFEEPRLIDTNNQIYIIPVGLVNLKTPEEFQAEGESLDRFVSSSSNYKSNYYGSGDYNNFVLFNQPQNLKSKLFSEATYIRSYSKIVIDSTIYLLFTGVTKDSNGDKKLNRNDLQSLFVYSLKTNQMKQVSFDNMGYNSYDLLANSNQLILEFTVDKDKNGEIERNSEPDRLKIFDLETGKIVDFADDKLLKELQDLID